MLVTVGVLLGLRQPGLTMAGTASCGLEEHTHTQECFDGAQCTVTEEGHEHSEACSGPCLCGKQEHTHTLSCYSDDTADTETQLDWQAMFDLPDDLDPAEALLTVARSQLGYAESVQNYRQDESGTRQGYTRYGAWYGSPYSSWSATFVSFCLHYAGFSAEEAPTNLGADAMAALWDSEDRFAAAGSYTPSPGDLIFFTDHTVGIVTAVENGMLTVIQGDVDGAVQEYTISILDERILGYGMLNPPKEPEETPGPEETPDPVEPGGEQEHTCSADCGSAAFTVTGVLPESVQLQVTQPENARALLEGSLNPNLLNFVRWYTVYDLTLTSGGEAVQPEQAVRVTVTSPDFSVREDEFFYVAHLDADTGAILSSQAVELTGQSITFTADGFSPYLFYTISKESEGGEQVLGTNWMKLRDSDYFLSYESFPSLSTPSSSAQTGGQPTVDEDTDDPSDVQIDETGGSTTSDDRKVTVSKTIDGTELENVFDITLTVTTQENISEIYNEPDIAVVIVMDISNTMKDDFGGISRYEAAMTAAEDFLGQFTEVSGPVSQVGYVAFNTDAHKIFDLTNCSTQDQAQKLSNTMRTETVKIINASGYAESHSRFTNIEAGLKMGMDMLEGAPNQYKYIIFLSDGFPTTYIQSGYTGYDPYTESGTPGRDGVFYDSVLGCHCDFGTSYSDKAAIRARKMATTVKNQGIKIFSIGIVDSDPKRQQTINGYERRNDNGTLKTDFSVIDRTGSTYEIGSANSIDDYKAWLRDSIGSGYYYDSTNVSGLKDAYDKIFQEIRTIKEEASKADWVTQDPLPVGTPRELEFIGFYDKNGELVFTDLEGAAAEGAENTALYNSETVEITWDLKASGYTTTTSGSSTSGGTNTTTTYSYKLVYRVRLKNELSNFVENHVYVTNGPTSLTYRVFELENGQTVLSDQRTVAFQIPAVHGYLAELTFQKLDTLGRPLAGAEFTLTHNTATCSLCRGDGKTSVSVDQVTATSDENGQVTFSRIPSGHTYILKETGVPPGFVCDGNEYIVTVAYDNLTVTVTDKDGTPLAWEGRIVNLPIPYQLPSTGGPGLRPFLLSGTALILLALLLGFHRWRKRKRGAGS